MCSGNYTPNFYNRLIHKLEEGELRVINNADPPTNQILIYRLYNT
jgi:hypothetical protein